MKQMAPTPRLSPEELAANIAAADSLLEGKFYDFEPVIEASGIPVKENIRARVSKEDLGVTLKFRRGQYIGFLGGNHVFQGIPLDDPRLSKPSRCFFHVVFSGGSALHPAKEQKFG